MLVVRRKTSGFTLVELLVVIGIIALLISMLMPALDRACQSALQAKQCPQLGSSDSDSEHFVRVTRVGSLRNATTTTQDQSL